MALVSLVALAFSTLALAAGALAAKEVVNYLGTGDSSSGGLGGQFNAPRGIAVNADGVGPANPGDTYVADELNHRIERFDSNGEFVSAWGADVVQTGGNGDLPGTDPFEICTVAAECKAGVASPGNGEAGGNGAMDNPQSVAVQADTGNVYVADRDNRRVNEYDGAGNFIASFGFDVDAAGGTEYEVCPAGNVCKIGVAGAGAGQIGSTSTSGTLGIAVSPGDGNGATGTVFLADSQNQRVNTYNLDGSSPSSFGSAAVFGSTQPRQIAVDSRGVVYASNSNAGGRIERYDSLNVNGGGTAFLTPITTPVPETQTMNFTGFIPENALGPGDQFKLSCPNGASTANIIYRTGASGKNNIQNGLNAACGEGNVVTTSNPPNVGLSFQGIYAGVNVPTTVCTRISGSGTCGVTAETPPTPAPLPPASGPETATAGLAVDPDSDGGGSDTDVLYVLRDPSVGATAVRQIGPTNSPGLTAPPSAVDQIHGESAGFGITNGVGLDDSGRLFVSSTDPVNTYGAGPRVYLLRDPSLLLDPVPLAKPVTTKTDTTATFSGTVDPKSALVGCKFQYSTDQDVWTDVGADGARGGGTLNGTTTVSSLGTNVGEFQVGQAIVSSDGGIPAGTTIVAKSFNDLTLSQAATTSGSVTVTTPGCATMTASGGVQPVSVNVTGLVPNTHYYVRLAAFRPLVPSPTPVASGVQVFDTTATAPLVSNVGSVQVADTSARMVGTIDPRNSATGYVFEYGITPALGSSTPPVDIGGGTSPLVVSRLVSGLKPGVTYYFRLVATNASGQTASTQKTLTTRTTPLPLPENRGYELVTPPDKNGGDADHPAAGSAPKALASLDGDAVAFCSQPIFGEPPGQFVSGILGCVPYLSRRGSGGWQTVAPVPRMCRFDLSNATPVATPQLFTTMDANLEHAVVSKSEPEGCPIPNLDPAAQHTVGSETNLYRQDLSGDHTVASSYELVSPQVPGYFVAGDADYSHVVYSSVANQTAEPDSPAPGNFVKLYLWTKQGEAGCAEPGGCLSLITKDTSGVPFTTNSELVSNLGNASGYEVSSTAISQDGRRVLFYNTTSASPPNAGYAEGRCDGGACDIYMREDAETTLEVSASECTVSCGTPDQWPSRFEYATPDAGKVFFTSCQKLTDASGPTVGPCNSSKPSASEALKLYRWDRDAPSGSKLVDLSIDHEPNDGTTSNANTVLGTSEDGDVVFFTAYSQLVSGAQAPFSGTGPHLYRWRWNGGSPSVDYITRFNQNEYNINLAHSTARVTPDAKFLLLTVYSRLDPIADQDNDKDVYRWNDTAGFVCASCQAPGAASSGDASAADVGGSQASNPFKVDGFSNVMPLRAFREQIVFSSDGGRVFFDTPDALVPEDTNGEAGCTVQSYPAYIKSCSDVYEWHDGTVSLISSGTGSSPSYLLGPGTSGDTVFFYTRQRLVGWDVDNNTDIYAARIGGGFPEPPAAGAPCEGESCRVGGTTPATTVGAGTAVFQGAGNPAPKHAKARKPRKKQRAHKKRRGGKQKKRNRQARHNRRTAR